jgi:hypothetical protein
MPSLAETQTAVRAAVVMSDDAWVKPLLIGGADPTRRLTIHRRHFQASLIETLCGRFPATAWLIGDAAVIDAAREFVAVHPPRVFCMAEFGALFPAWLGARAPLAHITYLEAFARLEWEFGRVSVEVARPSLPVQWLQTQGPTGLGTQTLALQPGTAWVAAAHNVDDLMRAFLSEAAPERFTLDDSPRWIEVRGSRGDVTIRSISQGDWCFRRALANGHSIEGAAGAALDADDTFDPGATLLQLFSEGLVVCP